MPNNYDQGQRGYVGHEEANEMLISGALDQQATQANGQGGYVTGNRGYGGADGSATNQGYNEPQQVFTEKGFAGTVVTPKHDGGFSGYGDPNPHHGNQQYGQNQYGQNQYGQNQQTGTLMTNQQGGQWRMASPSPNINNDLYARLPKVYGKAIVAVSKNGQGDIQAFKLEDGTILDYAQMFEANQMGALQGLRIQGNREGELIIRSVPDGYTDNNLDNLPVFQ